MAPLPPPPPPPGWGAPPPPPPTAPPYPGYGYGPPAGWTYIAPTYATRLGREYGGFWARLGAMLLDGLIVWAMMIPVAIVGVAFVAADWHTYDGTCTDRFGDPYRCTQLTDATTVRLVLTILGGVAIFLVVSIFYIGHYVGRRGATPGLRAAGLEVLRAETGRPIGFGRAIGRAAAAGFLSGQVLYLGYLWMLWDDNKQTWHDKIVGSIVVKAQR